MLTLADITLTVARIVTPENIISGTATAGATTSLTDTVNITTPTAYFDKGILWMQSGTNSGKVLHVTGNPSNKLNFAALTDAIAAGDATEAVNGPLFLRAVDHRASAMPASIAMTNTYVPDAPCDKADSAGPGQ